VAYQGDSLFGMCLNHFKAFQLFFGLRHMAVVRRNFVEYDGRDDQSRYGTLLRTRNLREFSVAHRYI